VNLGNAWLARFGGRVAYVVGGSKETDPQFWVFKDSWLPARIRWTEGGTRWDVRFVDYNSPAGDWFPRAVEVSRDGEQQVRFTTLSADPRASVPDRLF
jgi:outer membrane biogenesis lipoprotein LolB